MVYYMDAFLFSRKQTAMARNKIEAPSQFDLYVTKLVLVEIFFSKTLLNNPHNYCILHETVLLLNNVSSCDSISLEWKTTTTTTTNLEQTVLEQYLEHLSAWITAPCSGMPQTLGTVERTGSGSLEYRSWSDKVSILVFIYNHLYPFYTVSLLTVLQNVNSQCPNQQKCVGQCGYAKGAHISL